MQEDIINIDTTNMKEEEIKIVNEVYKIKQQIEISQLQEKIKANKNIAVQEKIENITNDTKIQEKYEEMLKSTPTTLLGKVNEEYEPTFEQTYLKEEDKIKNKYQDIKEELEKYGMLSSASKIIVIKNGNDIEGFLEYQTKKDGENVKIKVTSLYMKGQKKDIRDELINNLSEHISDISVSVDFDNVVTNSLSLQSIPETNNDIVLDALEPEDLNLQSIDEITTNPDILNSLNAEQLKAITELVQNRKIDFIDVDKGIGVTGTNEVLTAKKQGDDYVIEKPSVLNDPEFKIDDSLASYQPSPKIEEEVIEEKGPTLVKKNTNRRKQGYVDALIFTLITGFAAGILTTLSFLIIYIKLG